MCGIAGKLLSDSGGRVERSDIESMLRPIRHRGPDGQGIYLDKNAGLGHARLAIIDLSTGDQPMSNEEQTVWVVFNGEIYNFQDLREELIAKGHIFKSRSDTEVIVHAYEEFGPDCVRRLRGMFAFAIWDARRQRLFVARDRVGIKPLYYLQTQDAFYFASELKSIIAERTIPREVNHAGLRKFLCYNYLPGEETLLKGLLKLLPGHYLLVEGGKIKMRQYWDLEFTTERWSMSFQDAVEELQSLLAASVSDHMIADVPVGVLLSGGVDSSAVLSLATRNGRKVKSFTVGFDGGGVVDERPYARATAARFGTEHYETSITAAEFWTFLPSYVWHMEEPVCEPPAVALHYVTKLAREQVKVLLSGEGGDEAFAGYPNYPNMLRLNRFKSMLGPFAPLAGRAMGFVGDFLGDRRLNRYGYALGRPLSEHYFSRTSNPTDFFNRHAHSVFAGDFLEHTKDTSAAAPVQALIEMLASRSLLDQMLYVDTKTWLPDDLLVKADKMTMANSVELRVPLLDHRVLEFAASLPPCFKVSGKRTKRVLKAAFERILPADVFQRRKIGFAVPYAKWFATVLMPQVEELLLSDRALSRGYCDLAGLRRLLKLNAETGRYAKEIFALVVVEYWLREFADGEKDSQNSMPNARDIKPKIISGFERGQLVVESLKPTAN